LPSITKKIVVIFLLKPSKMQKNASVSQVGSGSVGKGLKFKRAAIMSGLLGSLDPLYAKIGVYEHVH
jgi:hypothetical protein